MISSMLRNKLVVIGIIVFVLAGAWFGLSSSSGPDSALSTTGPDTTGDGSIVSTLLTLQAITLKGTVLTDSAFATLRDFTTAIVPVPAGRVNPFAPLDAQATSTPAATKANTTHIFKPTK
jgi:hypothetical protein